MLDFNKLRDPAWQAKHRAEEAARQEAQSRKDKELRALVDACRLNYESLASNERSLVSSCHHKLNTYGVISDKQESWLRDIAKRCGFVPDAAG